jgi:acyl-CoA thioester hydrolase
VASARAVNVLVDQRTRKPVPLTDSIKKNFQRWLRRGYDGQ